MYVRIIILTVLCAALYFLILFVVPKGRTNGKINVFADFTDAGVTFLLNLMIFPFFAYSIYIDIERFIYGYSFLVMLLMVYNFRLAYKYNKGDLLCIMTAFISRSVIPVVDALFFGLNFLILIKYTADMSVSLKILWGFCLFSIAFFITIASLHNLATQRKFSGIVGFVKRVIK